MSEYFPNGPSKTLSSILFDGWLTAFALARTRDASNRFVLVYDVLGASPVEVWSVNAATGAFTMIGFLATSAFGYATGGEVTQQTNKSTTVELNTLSGRITMNAESLAAAAEATFTVTNSLVGANDVIVVNHTSAGTAGAYLVSVSAVAAGSFKITISNASGGALAEAI